MITPIQLDANEILKFTLKNLKGLKRKAKTKYAAELDLD